MAGKSTLDDITLELKEQNKTEEDQTVILRQIAASLAGPSASQLAEEEQKRKPKDVGGGGGFGGGALKGIMGIFKKVGKFIAMLKMGLLFLLLPAVLLFINSEVFKKALSFLKDVLTPALKAVWEWLKLLFADPKAALVKLWEELTDKAADIGSWIWDNAILPAWDWVTSVFENTDWKAWFKNKWDMLTASAKHIGQWIWKRAINPFWMWIKGIVQKEGGWGPFFWMLIKKYLGVYKTIGKWIWEKAIKPFWEWIKDVFVSIDWKEAFKKLFGFAKTIGSWIWNKAVKPFWRWIKDVFVSIDWKESFKSLFGAVASIGVWIWDNSIKPFWNWISGKFGDFTEKFAENWKEKFPEEGGGFWGWMWSKTLGALWKWIKLKFNNFKTKFTDRWETNFPEAQGGFWGWVWRNTLGGLWGWIKEKYNNFTTDFSAKWDAQFPEEGGGFWGWVYAKTLGKLVSEIKDIWGDFQETYIKPWTDAFKEHDGFWGWIYAKTLGALFTWLDKTFTNMGKAMGDKYTEVFGEGGITGWIWDHTIGGLFDWMKQVLDIDWGAVLTAMVPDWVKNAPGMGKFFGGKSDAQRAQERIAAAQERIQKLQARKAGVETTSDQIEAQILSDIVSGPTAQARLNIEDQIIGVEKDIKRFTERGAGSMGGGGKGLSAAELAAHPTYQSLQSQLQTLKDSLGGDTAERLATLQSEKADELARIDALILKENELIAADNKLIAESTTALAERASKPQSIFTHDVTLEKILTPMLELQKAQAALLTAYGAGGGGGVSSSVINISAPTTGTTTAVTNITDNVAGASDPYVAIGGAR